MVQFRFTSETPPQQLQNDIQTLNHFDEQQITELVEILLSFISLQPGFDFVASIGEFSERNGVNLNALKNTIKGIVYFFKGAIRNNLSPLFLKEDLQALGLEEEKANITASVWKQKFLALSRTVIGQTLMVNQLVDMDWKFGTTAANSDLSRVGQSFLQLKFVLDKGDNKTEEIFTEMTLQQFYMFYNEMQKAKASLEFFSY